MRLLRVLALLAIVLAAVVPAAAEDTGTYKLLDYQVMLTPHSDGVVAIDYVQKWQVTGGHIPWITVGLPGGDYDITASGGAAKQIAPANQGGWSGVRIDLDRDYQPGQSFEISFSVNQRKLFYADDKNYKLDFTPGWYDNATIDSLTIRLKSFAKVETVTADPPATSTADDVLTWTKTGLSPGEHFTISISFPKAALPAALPTESLRDSGGSGGAFDSTLGTIIFWVILLLIIWGAIARAGAAASTPAAASSTAAELVAVGAAEGIAPPGAAGASAEAGSRVLVPASPAPVPVRARAAGARGCTRKRTTHTCPVCRAREAERAQTR